jgi:hypothetical protein
MHVDATLIRRRWAPLRCTNCSRAHRLSHDIVRGSIDRHSPRRNTSAIADTAGSRRPPNVGSTLRPACRVKTCCKANGRSGRAENPSARQPHRVTFRLARRCFMASAPDNGTCGMAASAGDKGPRGDEGRKGASSGRKESVNDWRGTRDLGLASWWSSPPRTPRTLPPDEALQRPQISSELETRWVS